MLASLAPPGLIAIAVWLVSSANGAMVVDELPELRWGIVLPRLRRGHDHAHGIGCDLELVPRRTGDSQARLVAIDIALIVAFVAVTLLLPLSPPSSTPHALEGPVLRLVVTVLFAIRTGIRVTRPLLQMLETIGFQALLAARLLRAGKSGFLTIISLLAIGAVTVSSCALTTTLT